MNYDLIARAIIYGGGLFACWAIYATVRDALPRIREIVRGL